MSKLLNRFLKDDSGATAIEYGLIAALISIVIVAGASGAGNTLENLFNNISTNLSSS